MVNTLFKRFVGSEQGYETTNLVNGHLHSLTLDMPGVTVKSIEEADDDGWMPGLSAFADEETWQPEERQYDLYPVIRKGKIIRWERMW